MGAKRYSAGRIFLQVIPSFDNLQKDIEKHVNRANNNLEKKAADDGKKMGEARGKAEGKALRKVRQMSDLEQVAHDDKVAQASYNKRLKDFQRFSQMMIGTRAKQAFEEQRALDRMHSGTLAANLKRNMAADADRVKAANAHQDALDRIFQNGLASRLKAMRDFNDEHTRGLIENARREKKIRDDLDRDHGRALAEQIRRETKAAAERAALQGGRYGQDLRRAAGKAAANIPDKQIGADSSDAERRLEHLRQQLLSLADAEIGVDIDAAAAEAQLKHIKYELSKLDGKHVEIDIQVNAAAALAEIEAMKHAGKGGGDGGSRTAFSGLGNDAQDGANSFRIFNWRILAVVALLPLLTPLLAAAAGGIAALATAATGAAAGLGVMILGFSGIGSAVQAMGAQADAGAKKTGAAAKSAASNARTLRDALQGLDQARLQAARSAEDSARRIADAEKRLADAQRDATVAQEGLREARRAAQQDQIDLADKIAGGKLDERQALIDLFDAQVAYNNAMQDGGATNKEREQAAIDLERARLSIKGIRADNVQLAADQEKSTKDGIEGSARVQDAQDDVARAAQERADAARNLSDAQRDAARAEVDSLRAVRDATERVADARAAGADALAADTAAVDALALAMSKLSPAGRKFATFLFGLREGLYKLRAIAQEGMLPGVQAGMETIAKKYGPGFFKFVETMSKVVGTFFITLGDAFTSPVMATFFETMAKYAPDFFTLFGDATINIIKMFAGIMTAFAPYAKDFMVALADLTAGWADWAEGLKDNPAFQEFLIYLRDEGPVVWDMLKNIGKAIGNLLIGMKDNGTIDMFSSFFKMLADMDPALLGAIVGTILGLAVASQVAAGVNALAIAVAALFTPVGLIVLGIALLVGGLIWLYNSNEDVRIAFDAAWIAIKDAVKATIDWFLLEMWPTLSRLFGLIGKGVGWLWQNVFRDMFGAIGTVVLAVFKGIGWAWDNVLEPILTAIMDLVEGDFTNAWATMFSWLARMWDGVKDLFARPINWIIQTVLNDGLIRGINKIREMFGMEKIADITPVNWGRSWMESAENNDRAGRPRVTPGGGYASGGWTGPGSKYQPAGVVHADEFVVRKDSQRKMRDRFPGLLDYINATGSLPGFAAGGLVGFGRKLQEMGFQVGEHPAFGGVSPTAHSRNGWHYKAGAIDVNHDQGNEKGAIDSILALARAYNLRTIWQAKGHYDHAHFDIGNGADIGDMTGIPRSADPAAEPGGLPWWAGKPLDFLRSTVNNVVGKIPFHGGFIDMLKAIPGKLVDGAGSWLNDLLNRGGSGDGGYSSGGLVDNGTMMYDQGGYLPPGMTTVMNMTGRPEPVFTGDQWDKIGSGRGGSPLVGSLTIPLHGTNLTPGDVSEELLYTLRRIDHGGVYAGRTS